MRSHAKQKLREGSLRAGRALFKRALALLAVTVVSLSSAQAQTVRLQASDNRYNLDVVLNGTLRVGALIDPGATSVVVCEDTARALGLQRGAFVALDTVTERVPAHRTTLASIRVGPIEVRNVGALILGKANCQEVLLGVSFLRGLRSATFRGNTLTLRK
jgi:clan AA aspartic protease (TIGR02281 family)